MCAQVQQESRVFNKHTLVNTAQHSEEMGAAALKETRFTQLSLKMETGVVESTQQTRTALISPSDAPHTTSLGDKMPHGLFSTLMSELSVPITQKRRNKQQNASLILQT